MSIKLILIRHPETNKIAGLRGNTDKPSPKGLKQLSQIEEVCRTEGVEAVVHSTLPRASVSADLLAQMLDVPSIPEQSLRERDFGKWDSWEWPRISIELNKLSLEARYTFRPPDGETWQEMEDRLRAVLKNIAALNYDTVAAMTHAGSIRVLLEILGTKTKSSTINFIPGLGKSIVEEFDISSI